VTAGVGSATNPSWYSLSLTTYNGNIKNGATGAQLLTLPFVKSGISPIEIIKRPPLLPSPEDSLSDVGVSRLYNQASLRILLSDSLSFLPGGIGYKLDPSLYVSNGGPYAVSGSHPPFAEADPDDPDYVLPPNTDETTNRPLIDGYIQIEMQLNDNSWQD